MDWNLLLYLALAFAAGYFWGMFRGMQRIAMMMIEDPKRFREIMDMSQQIKNEAVLDASEEQAEIKVERDQGQYYMYTGTGEFLAQGEDFHTVFVRIRDRFPGRAFRVAREYTTLSREETDSLVRAVFEVFGDKTPDQERQKV
jgi:aspartate/methionine/tyrosine aminotransferase